MWNYNINDNAGINIFKDDALYSLCIAKDSYSKTTNIIRSAHFLTNIVDGIIGTQYYINDQSSICELQSLLKMLSDASGELHKRLVNSLALSRDQHV